MLYLVFDVESIGLHGEGFAAGYVVVDTDGKEHAAGIFACPPDYARGDDEGRAWVHNNCPFIEPNCGSPVVVRSMFWLTWLHWQGRGAALVADCAWPVEARFLLDCVADLPEGRKFQGPYPLHELASFLVAVGMDPLAEYDRLPDEQKHHPLGDARQSARLLVEALARIKEE